MNKRIPLAFSLISLGLIIFSCGKEKEEEDVPVPSRDISIFSSQNFHRFDSKWNGEDIILNLDGSLTIVGHAREQQTSFINQPIIFNLDNQKNISWTNFLNLDEENNFRQINLIPTLDQKYMALTYSNSLGNSNFSIDMLKVSQNGILNWHKKINFDGFREQPSSIIQLENGDYIILSKIEETQFSFSNQFSLHRVSENGNLIWSQFFDDDLIFATKQLLYSPTDNSIIALTEHQLFDNILLSELKIHKFSLDGNKIWTKSIIEPQEIFPLSNQLKIINGEHLFLSFSGNKGVEENNHEVVLLKLDLEANIIWEKIYKGDSSDLPEKIIQSNDGNFILLSSTTSFGNGASDIMLSKLTSEGNIIWDKVYGSNSQEFGTKIMQRVNGNIIIMGNTNHENTSDAQYDLFLLETDSEGNPI